MWLLITKVKCILHVAGLKYPYAWVWPRMQILHTNITRIPLAFSGDWGSQGRSLILLLSPLHVFVYQYKDLLAGGWSLLHLFLWAGFWATITVWNKRLTFNRKHQSKGKCEIRLQNSQFRVCQFCCLQEINKFELSLSNKEIVSQIHMFISLSIINIGLAVQDVGLKLMTWLEHRKSILVNVKIRL